MLKCEKHQYPNKKAAQTACNKRMSRPRKADRLRIYFCERCQRWHLTSLFWPELKRLR